MELGTHDKDRVLKEYNDAYEKYGYSPKTVLWGKAEKQDIRLEVLTSMYDFTNKKILDIGCGFGDLNKILMKKATGYQYLGIDINEKLVQKANEMNQDNTDINFIVGDFGEYEFQERLDYAVLSGTFAFSLQDKDQYEHVEDYIKKALEICNDGLAFNFVSDRVNFKVDGYYNYNVEKIISIAYKYSRNIVMRSDYMPFDFTIFIFKDDSFDEERIFNEYRKRNKIK